MNGWGWFGVRLVTALAAPVCFTWFAMACFWLHDHLHIVVFALLMTVLLGVVGVGTPVLLVWLTGGWGFGLFGVVVFVSVVMHVGAAVAASEADELIVLWRGEETACAVLDEQRFEEPVGIQHPTYEEVHYELLLDCAAPGVPERIESSEPATGERIEIRYEPSSGHALTAPDQRKAVVTTWVVGVGFGLWLLVAVGGVLLSMPLERNPFAFA